MDFLNKVTNMVGKGIDSIKTQINKAQENAFSAQPQNTNNLPKGVHILGVLENRCKDSDFILKVINFVCF